MGVSGYLKSILLFGLIGGGGSIAATFFIASAWQNFAIYALIGISVLVAIYSLVFKDGKIKLSSTGVSPGVVARSREDPKVKTGEGPTAVFYAVGVVFFGLIVLLL